MSLRMTSLRSVMDGLTKTVLDGCAKAIVNGARGSQDLSLISYAFRDEGFIEYLTEAVERYSNGQYTIRLAKASLFRDRVRGLYLYLVRCPSATPAGEVNELNENMLLVGLGPYMNGLTVGAERA